MTGPAPFFGFSCWPGARAACSAVEVRPGQLALSVYLDPISLVFNVPPFPGGEQYMARFLRQVARSADGLADQLEAAAGGADGQHRLPDALEQGWFSGGRADGPVGEL